MAQTRLPSLWGNDLVRILELNFSEILTRLGSLETGVRTVETIELTRVQAGSAPTQSSLGTSPAVTGYLLDSTSDSVTFSLTIPSRWKSNARDNRLRVRFWCFMVFSESAGDTIDMAVDYVTVRANNDDLSDGAGDSATQTATQVTDSVAVQSGATASGSVYVVTFVVDPDDADNGWDARDGYTMHFEVGRTTYGGTGEVDDIIVTHADLVYQASNKG